MDTEGKELGELLKRELGVNLKASTLQLDIRQLLQVVFKQFLSNSEDGGSCHSAFVDMCERHILDPEQNADNLIRRIYTGPLDTHIGQCLLGCDASGPLVVHIVKLYPLQQQSLASQFTCFGRILSGAASIGHKVRVLGEQYSLADEEDMSVQQISGVYLHQSRYRLSAPVNGLTAGMLVCLDGVDESIGKSATVVSLRTEEDVYICQPLLNSLASQAVFKVAIEPVNPTELPKMLNGLRAISKTFPICTTKVEESGEHIILGTGELYIDCILHDLRRVYGELDVRVSDPVVKFCETIVETSSLKCFAETPNKKYALYLCVITHYTYTHYTYTHTHYTYTHMFHLYNITTGTN